MSEQAVPGGDLAWDEFMRVLARGPHAALSDRVG
jgi:hypothetical protein